MHNSVVIIKLWQHENNNEKQTYTKFLNGLQTIGCNLTIVELDKPEEEFVAALVKYLRMCDFVIAIGCLTPHIATSVLNVYNEKVKSNCDLNNYTNYFHTLNEKNSSILWYHRFYFVDSEINACDLQDFLNHIENFMKKALYKKSFTFKRNKKICEYVDYLVANQNGLKTCKVKENEIIVSSNHLNEINNVQLQLENQCALEKQNIIYDNEHLILNSSCGFIQDAIKHIRTCFDLYAPENVFISFNGGKDCTVLLHLMLIVLKKYYSNYKQRIYCMYVQSSKPFAEVNDFIEQCKLFYNMDIHTLTLGIKDALQLILAGKPHLKACLMGTRRTDPFSNDLHHFQPTDNGWPNVMRVSPLLDWEFAHIWDYLLNFKVPYCKLYDEGYTSLGNVDNTVKNPQLYDQDTGKYHQAYKLLTSVTERDGRT